MNNIYTQMPFSPSRLDATVFIDKQVKNNFKNNFSILDVGCGGAYFLFLIKNLDFKLKYYGIDINPKKFKFDSKKISKIIIKKDFLKFYTRRKFNAIVCLWTLEHIKKDDIAIRNISNHADKNSVVIIAIPSIWSWPIEFGRHGFKYYNKRDIIHKFNNLGFKTIKSYDAGGFFGLIFMVLYSWPRYVILIPSLVIFFFLELSNLNNRSWQEFSSGIVNRIFYSYHKSKRGISIHNIIVSKIVSLDNKFKIFPSSYVLILKK